MIQVLKTTLHSVAAVALLAALSATPSHAAEAAKEPVKAEAMIKKEQKAHKRMKPTERVEEHLKNLHTELKVTAEQEPAWSKIATVMRENAADREASWEAMKQNKPSTALEFLKRGKEGAEKRVQHLDKLIAAVEPFYASLSAEQKLVADKMLRGSAHHGKMRKHKKHEGKAGVKMQEPAEIDMPAPEAE